MFTSLKKNKSGDTISQREEMVTLSDLMASSTLVLNSHIVAAQVIADWLVSGRIGNVEIVRFENQPIQNVRIAFAEYESVCGVDRIGFHPENTEEDAEAISTLAMQCAFVALSGVIAEERDAWNLWPRDLCHKERRRTLKRVYRSLRAFTVTDEDLSRAFHDIWKGTRIVHSNERVCECAFRLVIDLLRSGRWDETQAIVHLRKLLPRRKFDWAFGMRVGAFQQCAVSALNKFKQDIKTRRNASDAPHHAVGYARHPNISAPQN